MRCPENHPADHGDEPDDPNKQAEFVKACDLLFIFPEKHYRRPNCVEQHQQNGNISGDPVKRSPEEAPAYNAHGGCPCGICNKPSPEESQVPPFQALLYPFGPYANGVEEAGDIDKYDGNDQRMAHEAKIEFFILI